MLNVQMAVTVLRVRSEVVSFVLAVLLPGVVALLTKASASTRVKALVALVLAALVTFIQQHRLQSGDVEFDTQVAFDWFMNLVAAGAAYLFGWKPIVNVNERLAPGFGLGSGTGDGTVTFVRPAPMTPLTPEQQERVETLIRDNADRIR